MAWAMWVLRRLDTWDIFSIDQADDLLTMDRFDTVMGSVPLPLSLERSKERVERLKEYDSQIAALQGTIASISIKDWLLDIDEHNTVLQYKDALEDGFDSVEEIVTVYMKRNVDGSRCIDPEFFDDIGMKMAGHRRLFEQWFDKYAAAMAQNEALAAKLEENDGDYVDHEPANWHQQSDGTWVFCADAQESLLPRAISLGASSVTLNESTRTVSAASSDLGSSVRSCSAPPQTLPSDDINLGSSVRTGSAPPPQRVGQVPLLVARAADLQPRKYTATEAVT